MRTAKFVLSTVFVTVALCGATARGGLVVNGGFEDPPTAPAGGWTTYFGGDSFPGWTVGGHSVDVHDTGHTTAFIGKQSLDVSGLAEGSITQVIPTTPGATFLLSFAYAAHSFHPYSGDAFAEVRWGGALVDTISRPPSPNPVDINWLTTSYSVVANSSSMTLSFISLSPNGGILLDEIDLVQTAAAVPEPSGAVLLGSMGLGVLAFARRRRPVAKSS